MKYLGDVPVNSIIRGFFNTRTAAGAPVTLAGTPALSVYKSNSTTQTTSGVSLTVDFDSLTGLHFFTIDTSADAGFYSTATDFRVVITTGTVDSISVVGVEVACFSIENRLAPDNAGIAAIKTKTDNLPTDPADASDIASAFSTVNATLATIAGYLDTEVAAIKAKTDNLPADPADASDIAASFSSISSTLSTIAAYIDTEVAAIKAKTDNLPADPADASDIASSFSSLAASLATLAGYVDTEVAAIKAVTDKLDTAMELDSTVYRFTVNALEQAPSGGGGGSTDWTADERTAIRTILGIPASGTTPEVPSAGALHVIDDFLDTEISALTTAVADLPTNAELATALGTADDAVLSAIASEAVKTAAIKAKTDNLPSDPADASDISSSFSTVNSTLAVIAGYIDTEVAAIKTTTDRLSGMLVQDGLVYQFTANALELGPQGSGGGGGGGDATLAKQNEILALLGTGSAISHSPVSSNGEIEYGVVRGDDYLLASGRAFQWDIDPPAGFTAAQASCWFGGYKLGRGSWLVEGTIEEVTVDSVAKWRLKFQPRKADTVDCVPDQNYYFSVEVRGPNERITRVWGFTEVLDSRTIPGS